MECLKIFRETKGYSIKVMAEKLAISKSLYEKVEYGVRTPSSKFLNRFKQVFPDFDMNIFFSDSCKRS